MALFKRKDKDTKKGDEKTIGKIIYGFLLFAPLISIATRCLYVIFNKNAYQSYGGEVEKVETENMVQFLSNDTIDGVNYKTNFSYYENSKLNTNFYSNVFTTQLNGSFGDIYFNVENFQYNGVLDSSIKSFSLSYGKSTTIYLNTFTIQFNENVNKQTSYRLELNGNTYSSTHQNANFNNTPISFDLVTSRIYVFSNTLNNDSLQNTKFLFTNVVYYTSVLDNVFEYSIDQTQESNIYNWAKETGTYTVLQNATTGLGITNEFVPMLMAYWLIISVIYFLFDIALILIWAVHKKIHELSEAI